eukprot:gene1093-437_t
MSDKTSRNETEKYVKFFTYKSLQVIVQSRSGEKSRTTSKANAVGVDWFNVALPGASIESEIQREVKSEFANQNAVVQDPLWLNVYLKTAEGHDSILESWSIRFTEKVDQCAKGCFIIYNKLTLLLKTLISVSRSLPAYKLTRRKDKDFSFYYKISSEEPIKDLIAELPEKAKVGMVGTQFGTVLISVSFKTNIHLDSSVPACQQSLSLSKNQKKVQIKVGTDDQAALLNPLGPAEVAELTKAALDDVVGSTASLPTSFSTTSPHHFNFSQMRDGLEQMQQLNSISEQQSIGNIDDKNRPVAAFGYDSCSENSASDVPEIPSTPPLLSFIQGKIDESIIELPSDCSKSKPFNDAVSILKSDEENKDISALISLDHNPQGEPMAQAVGYEDDFVLVEVRPAFAPQFGDAGQLYRDCQKPPKLDMFSHTEIDDDNESFANKIERYETQLDKYDEFFRNLEHMQVT